MSVLTMSCNLSLTPYPHLHETGIPYLTSELQRTAGAVDCQAKVAIGVGATSANRRGRAFGRSIQFFEPAVFPRQARVCARVRAPAGTGAGSLDHYADGRPRAP